MAQPHGMTMNRGSLMIEECSDFPVPEQPQQARDACAGWGFSGLRRCQRLWERAAFMFDQNQ